MKRLTKKQQQWAWFFGLWCGGLSAVLLLAYLIRWMMGIS
ncbi:MAG: DUF2474 domain-containing protein [Deltaproteobacteria bacterium]|nr:DUF2474 domain-containing protein [Deltaproteobacteria bacterium]